MSGVGWCVVVVVVVHPALVVVWCGGPAAGGVGDGPARGGGGPVAQQNVMPEGCEWQLGWRAEQAAAAGSLGRSSAQCAGGRGMQMGRAWPATCMLPG